MTLEDEKYYETFFSLFATAGWKQFIEEVEKSKEVCKIENADTLETLWYLKGQLYVVDNALNFETMMRNAYDNIKASEVDDA